MTVLMITLFACDFSTNPDKKKEVNLNLSSIEKDLAQTDNVFTFNLLNKLSEEENGNLFISPLSISMALGMVYNGTEGNTKTEIAQLLGLSEYSEQEVNEYYNKMITLLPKLDSKVKLEIANSIWIREGFSVEKEFIDLNSTYFHAEIDNLDFSKSESVDIINDWVADATNDKIKTIIDDRIPGDVIIYLINALYFKGDWSNKFKKSNTYNEIFHSLSGINKTIEMMFQNEDFKYMENDKLQLIDLPYGDEKFSMTVILPKEDQDINELSNSLTSDQWNTLLNMAYEKEVDLYLPKFELEYKKELSDILKSLGMVAAFDGALSDLSGINAEHNLAISQVMHKTYLKVNEKGSEAAAVTSVSIEVTSMPYNIVMKVDRPFLLAIRELENGTILFIGKITDLGD